MDSRNHIFLLIALICRLRSSQSQIRPYKHIGCYSDNYHKPAMDFLADVTTVDQCAGEAQKKGFITFGLQGYGYTECYSGAHASKTYDKYGKSASCQNGLGGYYVSDVYQFTDEPLWPEGKYSIVKPTSGCPSGWTDNGYLFQDTRDTATNNKSSSLHIDGIVSQGVVIRWFCLKSQGTSPKWPKGQYCLNREGTTDPTNFQRGWIKMYNERAFSVLQSKTGITVKSSSKWYISQFNVFCQTTGPKSVPIDLPISQSFYLLPYGSAECQQVKWMVATMEWIEYGTNNYNGGSWKSGTIPYVKVGTRDMPGITVHYCYYQSCNRTLNDTQGVFQSPRYPNKYPDGQLCSWKIHVPVNKTLIVHFTNFSVHNDYTQDADVLKVYSFLGSSFQRNGSYNGHLEPFSLVSTSDLLFVFRSNGVQNDLGFHAEYKLIKTFQEPTTFTPVNTVKRTTTSAGRPTSSPLSTTVSTGSPTSTLKSTEPITGSPTTSEEFTPKQPLTKETSIPFTDKKTSTARESSPTTEEFSNSTISVKQDALKGNSDGTETAVLIVIPLVGLIVIVLVSVDIFCRWKIYRTAKSKKDDFRITDDSLEQVATNPTYGRTENIQLDHYNDTRTNNISNRHRNQYENTETSYDQLSRVPPKHQIPEQYQEPNASSDLTTQNHGFMQNSTRENAYQGLDSPTSSDSVPGDDMYHSIEAGSCTNNILYERAILYDSVA